MLQRYEFELVTRPRIATCDCPCGQLDRNVGSPRERDATRRNGRITFHDAAILRREHDVDRKPHEERVNAAAGTDDESGARVQSVPAQKPASSAARIEGGLDAGGEQLTVATVAKGVRPIWRADDRRKER